MRRAIVALLLLLAPGVTTGQGIGIFLRHDRLAEYGAGAGLNLLSRGPWIAQGWRRPLIRFAGVQVTSYAYERLFDYNGFNWSDWRQRLYGYAMTEGIIGMGKLLFRRRR